MRIYERTFVHNGDPLSEITLRRGERTRIEIIQAAHDLFVSQGFHGTTMRQIAESAEIALGGLYNHFASKEEVFEQVFLEYHPYGQVLPALLRAEGGTPKQFIQDAVKQILQALQDRPDFLNLMFIEIVEFKSAHIEKLFLCLQPQYEQIVANLFKSNRSELRPIPAAMLARLFLGFFLAYFLTEIFFSSQSQTDFNEETLDQFIDVFLHGVQLSEKDFRQLKGHHD